jgi:hypothetical protein
MRNVLSYEMLFGFVDKLKNELALFFSLLFFSCFIFFIVHLICKAAFVRGVVTIIGMLDIVFGDENRLLF